MAEKIWFITGTSRGFGRIWAEAALQRGDRVAATARKTDDLAGLVRTYGDAVLPLSLDVTDRRAVFAAVEAARERFGRIDVAISNAGYGAFGAIEEMSEAGAREQIETNLFGSLWVIQAALPIMRAQKSGHLISVSSIGGVAAFTNIGLYHASKWGLEGLNESLAQEVAPFGIAVTLVEPGAYSTDWSGDSAKHADELPAYAEMHEAAKKRSQGTQRGKPEATAPAMLALVDADKPPLRLFLGTSGLPLARKNFEQRLATWEAWQEVSNAAQG